MGVVVFFAILPGWMGPVLQRLSLTSKSVSCCVDAGQTMLLQISNKTQQLSDFGHLSGAGGRGPLVRAHGQGTHERRKSRRVVPAVEPLELPTLVRSAERNYGVDDPWTNLETATTNNLHG